MLCWCHYLGVNGGSIIIICRGECGRKKWTIVDVCHVFVNPTEKAIMPILGNFPQSESSSPRKEFLIPLPVICRCPRIWYYVSPNETKNSFENKVMWRSKSHLESMLWKQWLQLDFALGDSNSLSLRHLVRSVTCAEYLLCCVCACVCVAMGDTAS